MLSTFNYRVFGPQHLAS